MKKLLLFITIIVSNYSNSQSWVKQNSGITNSLYSVSFSNNQNGWAVGTGGKIVSTNDGGTNWFEQTSNETMSLNDVHFINNATGWSCGKNGVIKTTDGGKNWTRVYTTDLNSIINTIHFIDENTGWAAGRSLGSKILLLKTTDGGLNWTDYSNKLDYPYGANGTVNDLFFLNDTLGWFVGDDATEYASWKTTDGGETWNQMNFYITCPRFGVDFTDESHGWIAGKFKYSSSNGGNDWYNAYPTLTTYAYDVDFIDNNTGWMIGDSGQVSMTNNAGFSWIMEPTPVISKLYKIQMLDKNTGWIVGSNGTILAYNSKLSATNKLNEELLRISPNPSNALISININYNILKITDFEGRLIKTIYNQNQIDISEFSNGIYFFDIDGRNMKVVKE